MICRQIKFMLAALVSPFFLLITSLVSLPCHASPPNLLIILTDDQGYHDVGFNGSKDIPTPNLDSIASNGVRFSSGYAAGPLSSSSRAGLLTGLYPQRFGYDLGSAWQPENIKGGLPLGRSTLADFLGNAGYHCGAVGEWNLGVHPDLRPLKRGFKDYFGILGPGSSYFPEELTILVPENIKFQYEIFHLSVWRDGHPREIKNYLTDELSAEAARFINQNKDRPFFLYLAYNAPHSPLEATQKYLERFPDIESPHRKTYAAMVSAVDDGVGCVLAELRKDGLEEKTLVVFLSDTGGSLDQNSSDNYPLRGAKGSPWEGGWRVPFVMQWPGHLPKGRVYEQPVISLDIFATMAAQVSAPSQASVALDGVDLMPYLTGLKSGAPHDALFCTIPSSGGFAVRSGNYKLVNSGDGSPDKLYDVVADIAESKDLAESQSAVLATMEQKWAVWNQSLPDPVAVPSAPALPAGKNFPSLTTGRNN